MRLLSTVELLDTFHQYFTQLIAQQDFFWLLDIFWKCTFPSEFVGGQDCVKTGVSPQSSIIDSLIHIIMQYYKKSIHPFPISHCIDLHHYIATLSDCIVHVNFNIGDVEREHIVFTSWKYLGKNTTFVWATTKNYFIYLCFCLKLSMTWSALTLFRLGGYIYPHCQTFSNK